MAFTLIRNGTLIDGNGGNPIPGGAVLIEDNMIRAVGPSLSLALPNAPITEIDADGGTILPGFIDAHVHLMFIDFDMMRELTEPFSLMFYRAIEAMRQTQFVALAEVAMHRREHVMILRPGRQGLLAHTMFYADEIRSDQEHRTDTSAVNGKELQMAKLLVESLAAPFEPTKFKDKFREKLEQMIAAKIEGGEVAKIPAARKTAEVVDILQALENSLKLVRKPMGSPAQPAPERKTKQRRVGG